MAVRFVIGRAGSGKTRWCLEHIAAELKARPMGEAIYWILPRQATFSAERALTCDSGLSGFCRARVLSFDQLGHEILADCGGNALPLITPLGRRMILGHLLRKHQAELRFFKGVARQAGLAARLDATFAELERCGREPGELILCGEEATSAKPQAAGEAGRGAPALDLALRDKVHDLQLIYAAYSAYLGQERLDPHRRLLQVLGCIEASRLFRSARVYVDGFDRFTEYELRIIAQLGKVCRHVDVTLMIDPGSAVLANPDRFPDEMSVFHPVEMTYRRLRRTLAVQGASVDEPAIVLTEGRRFARQELGRVERMFAGEGGGRREESGGEEGARGGGKEGRREGEMPGEGKGRRGGEGRTGRPGARETGGPEGREEASRWDEPVRMVEAPDRRAEVDAAAREIRALMGRGMRLRDIAVLVRDLDQYHELIAASFQEHGIPFFADRRRRTGHHPLLQLISAILTIALDKYPHDAMMMLLKSGLAGLVEAAGDELENYVLRHRIRGVAWEMDDPWQFTGQMTRGSDEEGGDAAARGKPVLTEAQRNDASRQSLARWLTPFVKQFGDKRAWPMRQIVGELFAALERCGARRTMASWMEQAKVAGDFEQQREHEQVWKQTLELLDQMVELMGDEAVTLGDFMQIFQTGLDNFDLALTPPTVDQVLVGQVDRTITPPLRAALLLGLNEGGFPRASRENSVLSDSERRELAKHQIDIDPPTDRKLLDETLLGYVAFTRASEFLYVSRCRGAEDGKKLGASPFWRQLAALVPDVLPVQISGGERDDPRLIGTPVQLVSSLMCWARAAVVAGAGWSSPASSPGIPGEGENATRNRPGKMGNITERAAQTDSGPAYACGASPAHESSASADPHPGPPPEYQGRGTAAGSSAHAASAKASKSAKPQAARKDNGSAPAGDHAALNHPSHPLAGTAGLIAQRVDDAALNHRSHPPTAADDPFPALYTWLAGYPCNGDRIDTVRRRAWRALSYRNEATLAKAITERLFPSPLQARITQLERFAACPFQHLAHHGLRLEPREEASVGDLEMHQIYHRVLDRLTTAMLGREVSWDEVDAAQQRHLIEKFARELGQTLRGEILMSSARNRYMLRRIERTLEQVVAAQRAFAERGDFRTAAGEVRFGGRGRQLPPLALATASRKQLRLKGQIDRIDLLEGGEVAIFDYKNSGGKPTLPHIYYGLSLQLLAGLLVVGQAEGALFNRPLTPVAAFIVKLRRELENVDHPDDAPAVDDPAFDLSVKPRGLFNERFVSKFDRALQGGASQVINAYFKKDGTLSRSKSDGLGPDEFAALIEHVRRTMARLADGIFSGEVGVAPYRLSGASPCARCAFRDVCRFEPGVHNAYNVLKPINQREMFNAARGKAAGGGASNDDPGESNDDDSDDESAGGHLRGGGPG